MYVIKFCCNCYLPLLFKTLRIVSNNFGNIFSNRLAIDYRLKKKNFKNLFLPCKSYDLQKKILINFKLE